MWGDQNCCLSHTNGSHNLDLGGHCKMFRPSGRSSSPFQLMDLDMWDTKSHFTAQTSAWCGMAAVSGTGFLSNVSTSTSGSTGGFRQNDPGLRKWQSLSHMVPKGPPGAELRAARTASSFRQTEVEQWLHDAHERLDTQLDRLRSRNSQLSHNITTAHQLDMKHKQLSEAMSALEQEETAELSPFENSRKRGELHEKVLQLEKELLQMRSTLDRRSNDQPTEKPAGSPGGTLPMSREDINRQESQRVEKELCKLREALRDAEVKAKAQEEEQNQTEQKLQTSTEFQRALLNQIEEMNQRFSQMRQNHSEVQDQLSNANNKISQACLEKAILSTQVLKLEDEIKELKTKLTLPDRDHLIQRAEVLELQLKGEQQGSGWDVEIESENKKQDQENVLLKKQSEDLREVNEKLTCELQMFKQQLTLSQCQLQEITAERVTSSTQITDLESNCSQLIREKEELHQINEGLHEELTEIKEKCCQLRESVEVLELEKLKLQDRCLSLEAKVLEKEEKLLLQEEEYRKQDAVRVQETEELKAVATHWTEKWQKVALTLQSAQEELELERSRSQWLLHTSKDEGLEASVHTQETEMGTDLPQSSLLWEPPPDSHSSQNKPPQVCMQTSEAEILKQKLAEREKELRGKEEALKTLERQREMEIKEAQLKISALGLKASEEDQDDREQANISTIDSLRAQLEESRRRANQLQEEKTLAVQKLQTLRQLYQVKDEKASVEDGKDKTVCPANLKTEQQRRMVAEQLKNLFKEREGKEVGTVDNRSAAAQSRASSPQDWTPTSKDLRITVDRRSWQQGPGLTPVFEEDEEASDCPAEEEGKSMVELHAEENGHNQNQQISTMSTEINNLKAKNVNPLQALQSKQLVQDSPPSPSSAAKLPNLFCCSDETDLQRGAMSSLYPDGIFLAELVDICSPDEDEEEEDDSCNR